MKKITYFVFLFFIFGSCTNSKKTTTFIQNAYQKTIYYNTNDTKNAIKEYNQAIVLDKKNAFLYFLRGRSYSIIGKPHKARKDFSKAIYLYNENQSNENRKIDPNYTLSEIYLQRGLTWSDFRSRDFNKGNKDFSKAIAIDHTLKKAYLLRAFGKMELKEYQAAINDFHKIIQLDKYNIESYRHIAAIKLLQKDYPEAMNYFGKAIEIDSNNTLIYRFRGDAKFEQKDYKGAIDDYNRVIKLTPGYFYSIHNRGIAKLHVHQNEEAYIDFKEAKKLGCPLAKEMVKAIDQAKKEDRPLDQKMLTKYYSKNY